MIRLTTFFTYFSATEEMIQEAQFLGPLGFGYNLYIPL